MLLISGSWEGRSWSKSILVSPGSGREVGAAIGRGISGSFFAAYKPLAHFTAERKGILLSPLG